MIVSVVFVNHHEVSLTRMHASHQSDAMLHAEQSDLGVEEEEVGPIKDRELALLGS